MKRFLNIFYCLATLLVGTSSIAITEYNSVKVFNQVEDIILNSVADMCQLAHIEAPIFYNIRTYNQYSTTSTLIDLSKVRSEKEVNSGYLKLRK